MAIYDPIAWGLWAVCLIVSVACLWPTGSRHGNLRWLNPRSWFGLAFVTLVVFAALNIMTTGRTYRGILFPDRVNSMLLASALSGLAFLLGWRFGRVPAVLPEVAGIARRDGYYATARAAAPTYRGTGARGVLAWDSG